MASNKYLTSIKHLLRWLPDEQYIQLYYFAKFRRFANLREPVTFNEKLQWLKLNYRIPGDWKFVDKHAVKDVVREVIGDEYVIPTVGRYQSASEIDFESLPPAFVLKCTHDSEGLALVRDKTLADEKQIRRKLDQALARNFFWIGREPHYRHIQPQIIAEPYLVDERTGELRDYKFFCFDGEVKAMFIGSDRSSGNPKFDYFDAEFNPLDLRQSYPNAAVAPEKPHLFDEMRDIAGKLSVGHPHVRVDLYEANGRVYFGELTFFHFSGFAPFTPPIEDERWGQWLKLPAPVR